MHLHAGHHVSPTTDPSPGGGCGPPSSWPMIHSISSGDWLHPVKVIHHGRKPTLW